MHVTRNINCRKLAGNATEIDRSRIGVRLARLARNFPTSSRCFIVLPTLGPTRYKLKLSARWLDSLRGSSDFCVKKRGVTILPMLSSRFLKYQTCVHDVHSNLIFLLKCNCSQFVTEPWKNTRYDCKRLIVEWRKQLKSPRKKQ